ncbi:MAG: M20 family metallopeptidase [Deltaproteobacteria bacterium]|jgi:succinyl-diaminopimelate desuccinylase|nr:M20 family metallopeptidase [Deltaproteobacteria bacterium]MBW2239647.1 M20 family metallopeptidase [Deltaproteobacteria bacterium]MBW2572932.1 M20 family metallopeptidase [Deltaproteobacteria bacterium]MBW2670866.1 M20 family metallopeptidase [Deltaproteobacteria bacterium]
MEQIIPLTKDLIRFKSMHSKPMEIRRCVTFIENFLNTHEIEYRLLDHPKVPSILVAPSSGFVPVLIMSHIDVVDSPDERFVPVEKDQRLYGRGSLDDKYAVALSLVLLKKHLKRLRKQGKHPDDVPFGILITSDEEIGGFNGAKKALQKIKTDFCIVLDGGSVEKIVVKEKGLLRLKLISRGKTANDPRPWRGENALEKLIDDYIKIRTYFVRSAPEHWHRAVNISRIETGKRFHRVPKYAEAKLDIRYTENDDMEAFIAKIQKELHSTVVIETITPIFDEGPSSYLDLLLAISKNTAVGFEDGSNDARFLSEYGIKGIVWGADGDQSQHSKTEHVNVESVYSLYRILNAFIDQLPIRPQTV